MPSSGHHPFNFTWTLTGPGRVWEGSCFRCPAAPFWTLRFSVHSARRRSFLSTPTAACGRLTERQLWQRQGACEQVLFVRPPNLFNCGLLEEKTNEATVGFKMRLRAQNRKPGYGDSLAAFRLGNKNTCSPSRSRRMARTRFSLSGNCPDPVTMGKRARFCLLSLK